MGEGDQLMEKLVTDWFDFNSRACGLSYPWPFPLQRKERVTPHPSRAQQVAYVWIPTKQIPSGQEAKSKIQRDGRQPAAVGSAIKNYSTNKFANKYSTSS
jgi:hypothetical protein